MSSLTASRPPVNTDTPADPFEGTDDYRWELGPDPADAQWWAEQSETWDDPDGPEPDWDTLAGERAAEQAHQRGLIFA